MKVAGSSETSVSSYQTTRCHIPEDRNLLTFHNTVLRGIFGPDGEKINTGCAQSCNDWELHTLDPSPNTVSDKVEDMMGEERGTHGRDTCIQNVRTRDEDTALETPA